MRLRNIAIDLVPVFGIFTSGRRAKRALNDYDIMNTSARKRGLLNQSL